MFSNPSTETRIVVFNNRTIVISRVESHPNQFRIYIDSAYFGILTNTNEGEWALTPGFTLPKGIFTLLTKRIGIANWVEAIK